MRTHIDALGALIDDLFELSRLEAGDIGWSLEQVPLGELVGETVEAMRVQAEAKGVAVSAEVPSALAPARANPEKLQRVLFNLIQNAIRHTPGRRQRRRPRRAGRRPDRDRGRRHRRGDRARRARARVRRLLPRRRGRRAHRRRRRPRPGGLPRDRRGARRPHLAGGRARGHARALQPAIGQLTPSRDGRQLLGATAVSASQRERLQAADYTVEAPAAKLFTTTGEASRARRRLVLPRGPRRYFFCQHRLAGRDLSNHSIQLLPAGRKAAVRGIVAEPGHIRNGGIIIRQMQGCDAAFYSIDHEPGSTLPYPMFGLVTGKRVIETENPPDNEAAVCNVVGFAACPLLYLAIDQEWANTQLLFSGQSAGRVAGHGVRNIFPGADEDGMNLSRGKGKGCDGQPKQYERTNTAAAHGPQLRSQKGEIQVNKRLCLAPLFLRPVSGKRSRLLR